MTNHELIHEATGVSYDHLPITNYDLVDRPRLEYPTSEMPEGKYLFNTGTSLDASIEIQLNDRFGPDFEIENNQGKCENNIDLTDQETFEIFDDYVTRFSTIAWGQGSSADLQLPYLSSPVSEYTVIAVAQQGSGDSATLVSAISTTCLLYTSPSPRD